MRRAITVFLVLFLVACAEPTNSTVHVWPNHDAIDEYIRTHQSNDKFNGSLLVSIGDSIVHYKHYGLSDRNSEAPINDSTKFLIGSITKPFIALAVLLLEQEGKLSVNDKLSAYFPGFPQSDSVSLHQLLTHTSGIRDYHYFQNWKELSQSDLSPMDVVNQVKTDPYRFAPGSGFRYSNTGYILLGIIIEKASKTTFDNYVQTAILNPLGL